MVSFRIDRRDVVSLATKVALDLVCKMKWCGWNRVGPIEVLDCQCVSLLSELHPS